MKLKKYDTTLQIKLQKQLKIDAEKILAEKYNMSMSDFLREKLEELVAANKGDLENGK